MLSIADNHSVPDHFNPTVFKAPRVHRKNSFPWDWFAIELHLDPARWFHLSTANGGPVGIRKLLQIVHLNKNQRLFKNSSFSMGLPKKKETTTRCFP